MTSTAVALLPVPAVSVRAPHPFACTWGARFIRDGDVVEVPFGCSGPLIAEDVADALAWMIGRAQEMIDALEDEYAAVAEDTLARMDTLEFQAFAGDRLLAGRRLVVEIATPGVTFELTVEPQTA
ncbi:hypothetical protein [Streptomyces subrutilus]|uniref:hypothetical protein n=1 Tax=Streptomyces subrutilus TaxID=36818 RepID=UPI00114CCA1A|nr:hypothetical protein [Streptomyces subrutilus]